MSDIAYVKGAFFFRTLEQTYTRPILDAFLKAYFKHYSFQTINAKQFASHLNKYLTKNGQKPFNYNEWIYTAGLPKNCARIVAPRIEQIEAKAQLLNQGKYPFEDMIRNTTFKKNGKTRRRTQIIRPQYKDYLIQEWQLFIRALSDQVPIERLRQLDKQFAFSHSGNCEILCDWFVLAAHSPYVFEIQTELKDFLLKIRTADVSENLLTRMLETNFSSYPYMYYILKQFERIRLGVLTRERSEIFSSYVTINFNHNLCAVVV